MDSIIKELSKIRSGRPLQIDRNNSNRYRIVSSEYDGSKTSYCFSVPIYNKKTAKLSDLSFRHDNGISYASGSNTEITVSDYIMLDASENFCRIPLPERIHEDRGIIRFRNLDISPTLNGIVIKADCAQTNSHRFNLLVGQPFMNIRANSKYFSLMSEEFRPFVTVSCIGTIGAGDQLIAPATIRYQKLNDREYAVEVFSTSSAGRYVMFEINIFEHKLFQDTTVESADPLTNNAFGGIAFIGNTSLCGEQWLYTRPDFSRIPELMGRRVEKAILHLPQYNRSNTLLSAFRVASRFCSFGSNWDNKISSGALVSSSEISNGYQSIDVSELITDSTSKCITSLEGLILKTKVKDSGFSAVSTGDSYYSPQILEVNFK